MSYIIALLYFWNCQSLVVPSPYIQKASREFDIESNKSSLTGLQLSKQIFKAPEKLIMR